MSAGSRQNIIVKDLQVGYDRTIIIPNLSLEIPKEKITMVIGANGCGKSTLIKAVSRIIPPRRGTVLINGSEIKRQAPREVAKKIAILPQSPTAPNGLRVKELVTYGRFPYLSPMGGLKKHDLEVVEWAMESTGIAQFAERPIEALSGGQRQRAWIAMALAQETEILVLDEPTTYLDLSHQLEVLQLLQELNQKNQTTIVMVVHELNSAAKFAHHIIGMKEGTCIFAGTPAEVVTKENLRALYGIEATLQMHPTGQYPVCTDYELTKTAVC